MKLLNSPIHTTGDLERTIKKPENGLHVGGFFLLFFFFGELHQPGVLPAIRFANESLHTQIEIVFYRCLLCFPSCTPVLSENAFSDINHSFILFYFVPTADLGLDEKWP